MRHIIHCLLIMVLAGCAKPDLIMDKPEDDGVWMLGVNDDDRDNDGIIDYADFQSNSYFRLLRLRVPSVLDISQTTLTLEYSSSNPANIEKQEADSGEIKYVLPPGSKRVWTKVGSEERNPETVDLGGDFVDANTAYPLSYFHLEEEDGEHFIALYIESVRFGEWGVDLEVLFEGEEKE
jgi:hypothetical protein